MKSLLAHSDPLQHFWASPQEISQNMLQNTGTSRKKTAVKVHQSEKSLHLLDILKGGKIVDCSVCSEIMCPRISKAKTAKTHFSKSMARPLVARRKKCFQVNELCLPIWRTNLKVVHVGKHRLQIVNRTVHNALKHLHSIRQPKRSEQIFRQAKWRYNCCFWDVLRRDRDLVITFHKINF